MSSNSKADLPSESQQDASGITEEIRPPIPPKSDIIIEYSTHNLRSRKRISENPAINESKKHLKTVKKFVTHRGSFQMAREDGEMAGKWLLVNLQDSRKNCTEQNLNVWKDPKVKKLVSENFIFWQVYLSNPKGKWYERFYQPIEFPYVAIIDPRTGEKLEEWHKVNPAVICVQIDNFLSVYEKEWDRSSLDDISQSEKPQ